MAERKSSTFDRNKDQLFPLTPEMVRDLFESYEKRQAELQNQADEQNSEREKNQRLI